MSKRVVVTGGAGFVGSHVVEALLDGGHVVTIVDDLSTGDAMNLNPNASFMEMDITNPDIDRLLDIARPDVICHQAAQISIGRAQASPLRDLDVNVGGGLRLLEFARRSGCRFVHASSAAVYGEPRSIPVTEDQPTRPVNNYGVSKLAFEHYLKAYGATYGVPYVILRYANVYGPRQSALGEAGVVAAFCDAVANGEPAVVHGDGTQSRDFVYVTDVARANALALRSDVSGIFNISTGTETSVNRLFDLIAKAFGTSAPSARGPRRPGDIQRSALAPGLAAQTLGWRPGVDLELGVEATVRWFMSRRASE